MIVPVFTTSCEGPFISQCNGSYDSLFYYHDIDSSEIDHRYFLSTAALALQAAGVYSSGGLNTGITNHLEFDQRPALFKYQTAK